MAARQEQEVSAKISEIVYRRDKSGRPTSDQIGYIVEESKPRRHSRLARLLEMDLTTLAPKIKLTSVHGPTPSEGEALIPATTDENRKVVYQSSFIPSDGLRIPFKKHKAEKKVYARQATLDRPRRRLEANLRANKRIAKFFR